MIYPTQTIFLLIGKRGCCQHPSTGFSFRPDKAISLPGKTHMANRQHGLSGRGFLLAASFSLTGRYTDRTRIPTDDSAADGIMVPQQCPVVDRRRRVIAKWSMAFRCSWLLGSHVLRIIPVSSFWRCIHGDYCRRMLRCKPVMRYTFGLYRALSMCSAGRAPRL